MKIEYSKALNTKLDKITAFIEKELDLPDKDEFGIHINLHFNSWYFKHATANIHVKIPDHYISITKDPVKVREECKHCNHFPICKDILKNNLSGECPYYEPEVKDFRRED